MDKKAIAHATGVPIDEIENTFDELVKKGIIVSTTGAYIDMNKKPHDVRLLTRPVTESLPEHVLSLGPFAVSNSTIEMMKSKFIDDREMKAFMYSIARLCYEKTGSTELGGYSFSADDENMGGLFLDTSTYDLDNPIKFIRHSWFFPTKDTMESYNERLVDDSEKINSVSDLWSTLVSYGEGLESSKAEDRPDDLSYYPEKLIEYWQKFIPGVLLFSIQGIYIEASKGLKWKAFQSEDQVIKIIKDQVLHFEKSNDNKLLDYSIDRNLLVKEIFEYNGYSYTYEPEEIYKQLISLNFLLSKGNDEFEVNHEEVICDFKYPKGWKRKYDKYIETGSILFGYLKLSEIVK